MVNMNPHYEGVAGLSCKKARKEEKKAEKKEEKKKK
jgi:hypothetical protein